MSLFACICLPISSVQILREVFGENIRISDATEYPIGRVMPGGKQGRSTYFLQSQTQFDSTSLLRGRRKNDDTQMLLDGIEKLTSQAAEPIYLLFHFFRGSLNKEEVTVARSVLLSWEEFKTLLPEMKEDVKYKIMPSVKGCSPKTLLCDDSPASF